MKNVAVGQAERSFEIEWREDLARDHTGGEARRVGVDRVDHQVRDRFAMAVPG